MADILKFPGVGNALLVIDRCDDGLVLKAVNRPPIAGLPKAYPTIWEILPEGVKMAFEHDLGLYVTSEALEKHLALRIGPRP